MTERALPNYTWIKFPIACLSDRRFMSLQNATAGIYVKLYLLAARSDAEGLLCNDYETFNLENLAWLLHLNEKYLDRSIQELVAAGLMKINQGGYWITRFMQEQGPGDNIQREKWAERQRKSRARVLKSDTQEDIQSEDKEREEDQDEDED
jgi:hypothetical protein